MSANSYDGDIQMEGCVQSVALGKSSQGSVQLAVTFRTDDERYPIVTAYLYFSEAALPYTEEKLTALGWNPSANNWTVDDLLASQEIAGNVVDLVCAEEKYEGKTKLKVKFINAKGGGGLKEKLSAEEVTTFAASLRQRLGVTGGKKKAPSGGKKEGGIPF